MIELIEWVRGIFFVLCVATTAILLILAKVQEIRNGLKKGEFKL